MKLKVLILSVTALFLLLGFSPWEGAAGVAPEGELPFSGFFIATNSFPRNTVVDVTNLETGKTTRAIVANTLTNPGLLATVSRDAANLIGMRPGSISRIRILSPSDPIAYQRFTEGLAQEMPPFDSGGVIKSESELLAEVYGQDSFVPTASSAQTSGTPNEFSGPSYLMEPEWGGTARLEIVDIPRYTEYPPRQVTPPQTVQTPEPVREKPQVQTAQPEPPAQIVREPPVQVAKAPEVEMQEDIVKDVPVYITEQSAQDTEKYTEGFFAETAQGEAVKDVPPFIYDSITNQIAKDVPRYIYNPEFSEVVKNIDGFVGEESPAEIAKDVSGYNPETVQAAVAKDVPEYVSDTAKNTVSSAIAKDVPLFISEPEFYEIAKRVDGFIPEAQSSAVVKHVEKFEPEKIIEEVAKHVERFNTYLTNEELAKHLEKYYPEKSAEEVAKYLEGFYPERTTEQVAKFLEGFYPERTAEELVKYLEGFYPERTAEEIAKYNARFYPERTAEEIAKYNERFYPERAAEEEAVKYTSRFDSEKPAEEIAKFVEGFNAEKYAEEMAKYLDGFYPERTQEEIAKAVLEFLEMPAELAPLPPREIPAEPGKTAYNIVTAEERRPTENGANLYGIDPNDIIPGITASAVTERPRPIPVPDSRAFSIRSISSLDRGQYYVQLAAIPENLVENTLRQFDTQFFSYNPAVFRDRDDSYRILIGPLNQGESAAVLARFKSIGYRDAFVRRGG